MAPVEQSNPGDRHGSATGDYGRGPRALRYQSAGCETRSDEGGCEDP